LERRKIELTYIGLEDWPVSYSLDTALLIRANCKAGIFVPFDRSLMTKARI
jgi:hypothetical protein